MISWKHYISGGSGPVAVYTRKSGAADEMHSMNGRVYDQVVGRFLSADPYVQAPGFTQSFNRYPNVWNNPLSLTDPSGFETDSGVQIRAWMDRVG